MDIWRLSSTFIDNAKKVILGITCVKCLDRNHGMAAWGLTLFDNFMSGEVYGTDRSLRIPFPSKREAEIVYHVLRVDPEPKRSTVTKTVELEDDVVIVNLAAQEARQLRVSMNSILECVILITETMDQFGPPQSTSYSYY